MKTYGRKKAYQRCSAVDRDFREMCRLCLCVGGARQNIFDSLEDISLPSKILTCLSVEVHEGDGLPSEICFKCLRLLETFYKFRKKFDEVNCKLQEISKNIKVMETQEKVLQDKKVNTKINSVDSEDIYSSVKELESEIMLNNAVCIMDSLIVDFEGTERNDNSSFFSNPGDPRINNIYNNNSNVSEHGQESEFTSGTNSNVSQWHENKCDSDHCKDHKINSSCCGNVSFNSSKMKSSENCVSNKLVEESKLESVSHFVRLEHIPVTSGLIFVCDKCPKGFSKRIDLKRHSSVHDQQKGIVCAECEKWFPNKTSYKRHERTHTGERPFCCSYCQKCFSQESILSRHMRIHTGEKTHKCELCGKEFIQREGLKVHMRRHDHGNQEVQQQYYCPLCKRRFCHQSGLSRHLITHTGKTFDCLACSKSFSDQSSLKRHSKRHGIVKN